jgi:hypothetical protein
LDADQVPQPPPLAPLRQCSILAKSQHSLVYARRPHSAFTLYMLVKSRLSPSAPGLLLSSFVLIVRRPRPPGRSSTHYTL